MVSTDLWHRVCGLVETALDRPEADREAVLVAEAGGDTELLREARALLDLDTDVVDRLTRPPVEMDPPLQIGPYLVLSEIGRGGMSTVYLGRSASGEDPRPVAIKVLNHGFGDPDNERRFHREREILRRFRHPHIAAFYGSGQQADGRPYLVMEPIVGESIDRYCEREALDLPATLRLFREVCGAVAHAHRNLVVHRDIKPSNILVTPTGEPRLLDFGISKLLDPDDGVAATLTRAGRQAMTPQYASPEQIRGLPTTTSCDVYGLGVLLFELLAGRRPFDGARDELVGRILDQEPPRPSRVAEVSRFDSRRLRGDLDNIVLKALAKQPERRYGSVEALDLDLERYLTDRPVLARPPHLGYRLRKALWRQRRLVLGVVLAVVAVAGVQIERERQRWEAERQRDKALAVQGFLVDVFGQADPRLGHDGRTEVREVLHRGVQRIDDLAAQPELQAELAIVLGQVYLNLGHVDEAEALLRRALGLHRRLHGEVSAEVANAQDLLGQALDAAGKYDAAAELLDRALDFRRRERPTRPVELMTVVNNLALTRLHQGRVDDAEALARENLAMRRAHWGPDHLEVAIGLNNLAYVLFGRDEAPSDVLLELFDEGLELRRRHLGDSHPDVAVSHNNVAAAQLELGDLEGARTHLEAALTIWRQFLSEPHRDILAGEINLATVEMRIGEHALAHRRLSRILASVTRQFGVDSAEAETVRDLLAELGSTPSEIAELARQPAASDPPIALDAGQ